MEPTPELDYPSFDPNPYMESLKKYGECLNSVLIKHNRRVREIEGFLKSGEADEVCQEELAKLREVSNSMGYREILGTTKLNISKL